MREVRQAANLTQEQLGVRLGLDESSARARICRYESGEHEPPEATALQIAADLGLPLAYFYCADETLARIIRCYWHLDDSGRARLAERACALEAETAGR